MRLHALPRRKSRFALLGTLLGASVACAGISQPVLAADQTVVGAGNGAARQTAATSPIVGSAMHFLVEQAHRIEDSHLRQQTLDILTNPRSCALHRKGLSDPAAQQAIVGQLIAAGLVNPADAASIGGGLLAGIFPPILDASSDCPQLPQPFVAAPGSGFGGHHSYPGGLPVHESNNDRSGSLLAAQYRASYGTTRPDGSAVVARELIEDCDDHGARGAPGLQIDHDAMIAAPIWHDWAKSMVFQWNADGTEFAELNFGGNGSTDAWGAAGDSRTGGHHILSIAEAMVRGLSPLVVITQASAHSNPTLGNEYKVVNWLRAAAIIARIDPVAAGYLAKDATGKLRLPPLGALSDGVDLAAAGQGNVRVEYELHNLSDADFTFSIPAVGSAAVLLAKLAPEFGYDPTNAATYNVKFRNPALSQLTGERLLMLYGNAGLDGVRAELQRLRSLGVI